MNDTATPNRPAPVLLLALLVFGVVAIGYLASRQRDAYVSLNINNQWHIYLVGEDRVDAIKFHIGHFSEIRHDSQQLWLRGDGEIHWLKNVIRVHKTSVYFNNKLFTQTFLAKPVNILFLRNGTARLGTPGNPSGS